MELLNYGIHIVLESERNRQTKLIDKIEWKNENTYPNLKIWYERTQNNYKCIWYMRLIKSFPQCLEKHNERTKRTLNQSKIEDNPKKFKQQQRQSDRER